MAAESPDQSRGTSRDLLGCACRDAMDPTLVHCVRECRPTLGDDWQRRMTAAVGLSPKAREALAEVVRVVQGAMCRHCGALPDEDGDHSCPCPFSDSDCKEHPA